MAMEQQSGVGGSLHGDPKEYEVAIVGAGLAGLQCAHQLIRKYGVDPNAVIILEAQDYIGGRVKQTTDFLPGCKIDLGAEFIHGDNSMLNDFAQQVGEPLEELFCWAHGDGGPSEAPVGDGYGLYYIKGEIGENKQDRLLRFDDKDDQFMSLNRNLWDLYLLDEVSIDENLSLLDYLREFNTSDDMLKLAAAGFANTMCSTLEELSLKQCVRWAHEEHYDKVHSSGVGCQKFADREGKSRSGSISEKVAHSDYRFKRSYAALVEYLKADVKILCNTPIARIDYGIELEGGKITLHTASPGIVFRTKKVVVTCSPHVLSSPKLLEFNPPLPMEKVEALSCVSMYTASKIILMFSSRFYPEGLHGIIMGGTVVPEVWFKEATPKSSSFSNDDTSEESMSVGSSSDSGSEANETVYIAVGFLSAKFAEEAHAKYNEDGLIKKMLEELDTVFSNFKAEHLAARVDSPVRNGNYKDYNTTIFEELPSRRTLPLRPSSVFVKGMVYDWSARHPYIGGAYASPKVGKNIDYANVLASPVAGKLFFAGEATNNDAGACTHSALETGVRAADEIMFACK